MCILLIGTGTSTCTSASDSHRGTADSDGGQNMTEVKSVFGNNTRRF